MSTFTRCLAFTLFVCALASFASGELLVNGVNATISAEPILATPRGPEDVGIVYSSLLIEGAAGPVATGPGGSLTEDYVSTITSPSTLAVFGFVGGVANAGEIAFFDFHDTGSNFVSGFGVQFPQAGDFIWTITLNDPTANAVPAAGFVTITADDGTFNASGLPTDLNWWEKDIAPAIGTSAGPLYSLMEIDVIPEPASACLMGFAGLMGIAFLRRRS